MRQIAFWAVLGAVVLALAGCGSSKKTETKGETDTVGTQAACDASALSSTTKLPPNFPKVAQATYTTESTEGPTDLTEGYFMGSVKDGHEAYKTALGTNGYEVTDDELDEHDSEVNWKGHGRSGQVALREQCGESDKIYVKVTNRPA
ncbi:MAG TPA: hypothetical protein VI142_02115 [Gaiellaceae bacterium]